MKCLICNKEFTPNRPWQRYCCPACKREAYRQRKNKEAEIEEKKPIIREFHCRRCGALVQVKDHKDFRMRFCSQKCEKAYWKHSHKKIPKGPVFQFHCEECGTLVTVSDTKDKRKRFCSAVCRSRWNNKKQAAMRAMEIEKSLKEG